MRIIILGAAGFIGANLTLELLKNDNYDITLVDKSIDYFGWAKQIQSEKLKIIESDFNDSTDFSKLLNNQDIVFHLVSTTIPTTSNQKVSQELSANVVISAKLFDACVTNKVKRVIFISSGGTVYGKEAKCPLSEETPTYPISSYGLQKITIEKLLYLYEQMYQLDYRVIRLANPYGPYQRPNGQLGAVTTFTYKAMNDEEITVYGDGSVVRDYIYIADAIQGIMNIAFKAAKYKTFNLGSGIGTSINELIKTIRENINPNLKIVYKSGRSVDVPVNFLDISRYRETYGDVNMIPLSVGVRLTAEFLERGYSN